MVYGGKPRNAARYCPPSPPHSEMMSALCTFRTSRTLGVEDLVENSGFKGWGLGSKVQVLPRSGMMSGLCMSRTSRTLVVEVLVWACEFRNDVRTVYVLKSRTLGVEDLIQK